MFTVVYLKPEIFLNVLVLQDDVFDTLKVTFRAHIFLTFWVGKYLSGT